jgi:hypothetical protein
MKMEAQTSFHFICGSTLNTKCITSTMNFSVLNKTKNIDFTGTELGVKNIQILNSLVTRC